MSAKDKKNSIASISKDDCYGCGACVQACPAKCIDITVDSEGFFYPHVENNLCLECGLCKKVCPSFSSFTDNHLFNQPLTYGVKNKNDNERFLSSSGGVFPLLVDYFLLQNGTVYGAKYDFSKLAVRHSRATEKGEAEFFRKSKYVQSDTTKIFTLVENDLKNGKKVLFSGTPCQIEALKLFLGDDYQNLLTIDFICHGVPSPGVFKDYFSYVEKRNKSQIINIDFRTKKKGWGSVFNLFIDIEMEIKNIFVHSVLNPFYLLFSSTLIIRPCCYNCKFATVKRISDITLGDFWKGKKYYPGLFDGKGTSLLLVNTEKGLETFSKIKGNVDWQNVDINKCMQLNLYSPTPRPMLRSVFFDNYFGEKWAKNAKKYYFFAILVVLFNRIKSLVGMIKKGNRFEKSNKE